MAYLSPHFEPDVFMSYAHGTAPGKADSPLRRWSLAFIDCLKEDIYGLCTDLDGLKVWDDRDLDPTAAGTDVLRRTVEKSCLLLIVMSPRYLSSPWCTDELEWFRAQFAERRKGPGRIFIVRAVSTNHDKWPDFLKDERGHPDLGFQFHPNTDKESVEPYGWPDLVDRNEGFRRALSTLRTTLTQRLREIRASYGAVAISAPPPAPEHAPPRGHTPASKVPPSTAPSASAPAGGPPRLYLHARPEDAALRQSVIDYLRHDGFRVVPPVTVAAGATLSDWNTESKQRIEVVQRCDVLTILRASADPSFGDELLDIAVDERERINAVRQKPICCAVLDASQAPFPLAELASQYSIQRFDLNTPEWRPSFKSWTESCHIV